MLTQHSEQEVTSEDSHPTIIEKYNYHLWYLNAMTYQENGEAGQMVTSTRDEVWSASIKVGLTAIFRPATQITYGNGG